jgi:phenylpropionate dioxygenase-like ring-hydroxylating dioxygenase large terminal subunit
MHKQATRAFGKVPVPMPVGAKSLPQKYFVAPEIFAREQQKIFARQWLLVGHQSQIPGSGDFFLATVANESLIVVRDQHKQIRAFYNVCRHRGSRLKEHQPGQAVCGHSSAIQCPYHAWSYNLEGRLLGAPHMDEVPGFEKSDYSLVSANLGLWGGFIFVNLANGPVALEKWFAPLNGKFSHWNMSILTSARRIEYDVHANWKLMFENYSECYHCPGVHPQLQKVSPYDSAENDLRDGPFLGGFMKINRGKSLTMSGNACAAFVGEIENLQQVFYYSIFPNMLLSLHPEYVMVHQLWPQSPERTLIVCDWFFHPDAFQDEKFNPNDAIEFWDMTNRQDWHVCELSQQGIASRSYQPGPFSARESIPAAWDDYYLRVMK